MVTLLSCWLAEVADLAHRRLSAITAACAASAPANELACHNGHPKSPAPPKVSCDDPAAPPPALAPDAAALHHGAAETMQLPASTATAGVSVTGCMQQPGAGLPAGAVPAESLLSRQPAFTDENRCSGATATTEVQQSDDECVSPTDRAPASRFGECAAAAADGTIGTSGNPDEGSDGVQHELQQLGADGPGGSAGGDPGSTQLRGVTGPVVSAAAAAVVELPAGQLNVVHSPPHAGVTGDEMDGDAPLAAHLPLQLAADTDDETVNITSPSPCRDSTGRGHDAASGEGLHRLRTSACRLGCGCSNCPAVSIAASHLLMAHHSDPVLQHARCHRPWLHLYVVCNAAGRCRRVGRR